MGPDLRRTPSGMQDKWPAFGLSVLLHAVLITLLSVSLSHTPRPLPAFSPASEPVKAVVVDERKVKAEMERLKAAEAQKRQAEAERVRRLKAQEAAARKAREQEQQRLARLKRQREAEAAAAKKAQAAEQKRLADLKRQKAEEARKRQAAAKAEQERLAKLKAEREAMQRKRKAEEQRLAEQERQRKMEAERKRQAEEAARRKAEEERKRREAEAALKQQMAAEQQRLQAEQSRQRQLWVAEYKDLIAQKVERNWLRPAGTARGLTCRVLVHQLPTGDVVSVEVVRSSGNGVFDRSVENAVRKASPLPPPPDKSVFDREIVFNFEPSD
jgi:colicin import membrane protein